MAAYKRIITVKTLTRVYVPYRAPKCHRRQKSAFIKGN